ncbi:MAG: HD domain-containing protein, partial [Desulfobacterales bacterium]|nr:HD domain-containing protein [Desulfobacterales bacterium]
SVEAVSLNQKLEILKNDPINETALQIVDKSCEEEIKQIFADLQFIKECNKSYEFMNDTKIEKLNKIAKKTYIKDTITYPYLTKDEVYNLSIRKGTLTEEERKIIENHALMTLKILEQIPFPKRLSKVPDYAASHHEKMDGSGYPRKLSGKDLPIQARIMLVADVFEALTAKDRPYKAPMTLTQALKIIEFMKKDGHIDPDIYDLFVNDRIYREYAKKELDPEQIDEKIY